MSNAAEDFIRVLMWSVSAADDYRSKMHSLVVNSAENEKINLILSQIPFGPELLAGIHSYSQSAIDCYFSLRLLTIPNGSPQFTGEENTEFRLTLSGCAVLLRQFIEGAVFSNWLLDVKTRRQVTQRGFAFYWENLNERLKYERAMNSDQVGKFEEIKRKAIADGHNLDLLITSDDGKKHWPQISINDATGKLREVSTKVSMPDFVIKKLGKGITNGEWIYHWLSGLTHGLSWSYFDDSAMQSDMELVYRSPDVLRYAHSALLGMQLFQEIFPKLENGFEATLLKITNDPPFTN